MPTILHNPIHLTERRSLRQNQTKAEKVLWYELRNRGVAYKFRRQVSIGPFIVDFYCHSLRFAIELDGPIHGEQQEYDRSRQMHLERQGIRVVRYTNDKVLFDRENVMREILKICFDLASPLPSPSVPLLKERGTTTTPLSFRRG